MNVPDAFGSVNPLLKQRLPILLLLLLACVVSRMATTIYYIEDIDCLRFALSATDYDIASFKPHFPGYPVYCFFLQGLTMVIGRMALAFSILGGIAIFLIIIATAGLQRSMAPQVPIWPIGLLIFFNPQLWIMSNSFMPDILGLGVLMCCLYCFAKSYSLGGIWIYYFHFLFGIMLGIRLSYAPMLIIPWAVLQWRYKWQFIKQNALLAFAIFLWLVPMIIDTGWHELIVAGKKQTDGHFNKWGGSVLSSKAGFELRFLSMFQSVWADGMGGWWPKRAVINMVLSVGILAAIIAGKTYILPRVLRQENPQKKQLTIYIFIALMLYILWAFFGQNIIYKPRHMMPVVPFVCLVLAVGLHHISQQFKLQKQALVLIAFLFLLPYVTVTAIGIHHHEQPTAVSQMKEYLLERNDTKNTFIGSGIMGFYMQKHYWQKGQILELQIDSAKIISAYERYQHIYSAENIDGLLNAKPIKKTIFYHDPFTNRMWATLTLYEYQK